MKKQVVLFSGGLDSAVLLVDMLSQGNEVRLLTFDYGQKNKIEVEYASKFIAYLSHVQGLGQVLSWQLIDITSVANLLSSSSLLGAAAVPTGEENKKSVIVPNRNMIMLAIAAGFAINLHYDEVVYANHIAGLFSMPDCRPEFVQALAQTIVLADDWKVNLVSPYQNITKGDIVKRGIELGIDFGMTYSCYVGAEEACGECKACVERQNSLK